MKKLSFLLLSALFTCNAILAQVSINNDQSSPDPSSMLDVKSTSKGILIPRMTLAQRNAIVSPAEGLLVFVSDDKTFYYYSNSAWQEVFSATHTDGDWTVSGNNIYSSVSGNVGIGVSNPQKQLDLSQSIQFPITTNSSAGIIYKSGVRFLHDFKASGTIGYNTFLGLNSGNFSMSGSASSASYNTGIGAFTLSGNTTGKNNSGFGYNALLSNTTGESNTALGAEALNSNQEADYNTAVGHRALYYCWDGEANTAIGVEAGRQCTTGDYNTIIGADADILNQEGSNNTVIGFAAGYGGSLHSKSGNVLIGYKAGFYETGSNKLYIDNSDTVNPLIKGDFATNQLGINGKLGIGTNTPAQQLEITQSIQIPSTEQYLDNPGVIYKDGVRFIHNSMGSTGYNTFVGVGAGALFPAGQGYANGNPDPMKYNTGMGYLVMTNTQAASHNTAMGYLAQRYITGGYANTAIGFKALCLNDASNENTAYGSEALYQTNNAYNTGIGAYALRSNINGAGNVALGYKAGYNETGSNKLYIENSDSSTPLIGGDFSQDEVYINGKLGIGTSDPDQSLEVNGSVELPVTTSSSLGIIHKGGFPFLHDYKFSGAIGQNVFLGKNAGNFTMSGGSNYQASDNVGIGTGVLHNLTNGFANTAIGSYTMPSVQSGIENSAIGLYGLYANVTGSQNCALGAYAGRYNSSGSHNVILGFEANNYNQNGSDNTVIGYRAGYGSSGVSKSGNVFIGAYAGHSESGSNKLYIENSTSVSPLIGGDFSTNEVFINTKLGINNSDPQANLDVNGNMVLQFGAAVNEFSTDATLSGFSDNAVPTEAAVKTYADALIQLAFPVGSIIAWAKNMTGVPALSEMYAECNGQTITDQTSPLYGQVLPNLNGEGQHRFLRGSGTSGATGGTLTHSHLINGQLTGGSNMMGNGMGSGSNNYVPTGHQHYLDNIPTDITTVEPPYYNVVWIMRVK